MSVVSSNMVRVIGIFGYQVSVFLKGVFILFLITSRKLSHIQCFNLLIVYSA